MRPQNSSPTSRRAFLKRSAAASAVLAFPAVLRAARPNSRVHVATVGVDGMGYNDIHNISAHEKVQYVGFCDIDSRAFARADKLLPGVPHFTDFRVMLDRLGDRVDAISVATPDHMHAVVAVEAMKRGKHVYCQKPLAQTVWECRQMRLWAERQRVVTQMGNQVHSQIEYRLATRLLREGAIGKVKEVHSWCGFTGNERTRLLEPPAGGSPVPPEVNWDLWIGGAPMRPYVPAIYHPFAWRDWQDFGGGAALGDFGCHILDPVFTGLGLKAPVTVSADNSGINGHVWPTMQTIRYVFPGNALIAGPTLTLTWSDGGLRPDRKLAQLPEGLDLPRQGSLFIGELGNMVLQHAAAPRLYPLEKFTGFAYPKEPKVPSHWHRWVDAIVEGGRTTDGFDYAGPLSETVQLGNVAARAARPPTPKRGSNPIGARDNNTFEWDAERLRFTDSDLATRLVTRTYRRGFEVTPAGGSAT